METYRVRQVYALEEIAADGKPRVVATFDSEAEAKAKARELEQMAETDAKLPKETEA